MREGGGERREPPPPPPPPAPSLARLIQSVDNSVAALIGFVSSGMFISQSAVGFSFPASTESVSQP